MTALRADRSRAAVLGGGLAGLLAASILSKHFARVLVIERDRYPEEPLHRNGVPQAHHVHGLLLRGLQILEELFPGIRGDLARAGAGLLDSAADILWLTPAGLAPLHESGLPFLACSRPLIDHVVRRRVCRLGNVEFAEALEVTGLCAERAGRRITGVRLRGRGGREAAEAITADFVVDATGRTSRAPEWLTALGYIAPKETLVDGHLGYASRIFARDPDAHLPWRAVFSQAAPPRVTRAALAFPIEGERWVVTLAGRCGDYPPADAEGFAEFARSLPCSEVFRIVTSSGPLSPIRCFRATQNRLHHYERIPLPEGFAILGDAVCAFNPVYGQGMSAAAIGTKILDGCLVRGRLHNFQQDLAKALSTPWTFATSEDARYPGTEGIMLSSGTRATHWYLDRVIARSVKKEEVRTALLSVMHMTRGVTALFRPRIALPILFGALAGKVRELWPRFSQRQVLRDA